MKNYETLLDEACENGITVKEKPLISSNGRIKGKKIAIRKDIDTDAEKACTLAEELGHYHTTVGDIMDMSDAWNRKQERQARLDGYNRLIGLKGLISAFEHGYRNWHDTAQYLDVTEEYLRECIDCYRDKYGMITTVDNYWIMFIPHFGIGRIV